jgi:hypothetical protein
MPTETSSSVLPQPSAQVASPLKMRKASVFVDSVVYLDVTRTANVSRNGVLDLKGQEPSAIGLSPPTAFLRYCNLIFWLPLSDAVKR